MIQERTGQKGKMPPHNLEAEQAVLGGIFLEKQAIEIAMENLSLNGSDFYQSAHAKLFEGMVSLYKEKTPIDIVTIANLFSNSDVLSPVGGIPYVAELVEATPTAANIGYYARIVKDRALKRELISKATNIITSVYDGNTGVEELIDRAQRDFLGVSVGSSTSYEWIGDVVDEVVVDLKNLHEKKTEMSGLNTGLLELNELLGGLQKTDLIVIAGRPSMGKSSCCMQIAGCAALNGKKVGIFPIEVGKKQLVKNIMANLGNINTMHFRDGNFKDMNRMNHVAIAVAETNIFIDDTSRSSTEILRQARRMKKEKDGLDAIFIDHLQLIRETGRFDSRNMELEFAVNNLKSLAKELDIPVVLVSQLSREVEKRNPPKPRLSDCRDTGVLEQTADVIMFLYRPGYYDKKAEDKGVVEIMVEKQRNGPLAVCKYKWVGRYLRFEEL